MIVDDDAPLSSLIARILTKSGRYTTCVENNPLSVTKTAEQFRPDVFLLDVDMPRRDGGSVLADLREHPLFKKTPAAFLTSLVSGRETGHGVVDRGGQFFMSKTLDLGSLERGVHRLMDEAAA